MRNINLVPKVPRIQQIFLPTLAISALCSIAVSSTLFVYYFHVQNTSTALEAEQAQLQSTVALMTQQRMADPMTNEYNRFSADLQKLKAQRRYWMPVLELMTSQLPEIAKLRSVEVVDQAKNDALAQAAKPAAGNAEAAAIAATPFQLNVTGDFAELNQIAEYMIRLQRSTLVDQVTVTSIQRSEQEVVLPIAASSMQSAGSVTGTSPTSSTKTQEDYLKELESSIKVPETKGDELLNELRWLMTQQMVGQQFGMKLPEKPAVPPVSGTLDRAVTGSALTQEDITSARRQVEQFKKQDPTKLPASSTPTNSTEQKTQESKLPPIVKYSVTLQVAFKAQAK